MLGGQSRKALRPDTARHIGLGTSNLDTDISSITSGRLINIQIVPGHQNPVDQYTLSNPVDVAQLAMKFGVELPGQLLREINNDLQLELSTIQLYEDTMPTLQILKERGFKIALCSNLAMPYGEQLRKLLPDFLDAVVFSYEVGAIKPEHQIYKVIQAHFGCDFPEMLFIGDHPILDVETPISLGMKARLIERHKNQRLLDVMGDLI